MKFQVKETQNVNFVFDRTKGFSKFYLCKTKQYKKIFIIYDKDLRKTWLKKLLGTSGRQTVLGTRKCHDSHRLSKIEEFESALSESKTAVSECKAVVWEFETAWSKKV